MSSAIAAYRAPYRLLCILLGSCTLPLLLGADAADTRPPCLFGTALGEDEQPVGACPELDPLHLERNLQVRKLIAAINMSPQSISFAGCPGSVYAVQMHSDGRYVITYPPEIREGFIAPVAHEIAHIVQIQAAGGLDQLQARYRSRRVELGADYLAGILFRRVLPEVSRNEFQNHVHLKGLYREPSLARAHGTPVQRTAAFRFGIVGKTEPVGATLAEASEHFQEDLYEKAVSFR